MKHNVQYKGYGIRSAPYPTASDQWTTDIYISIERGGTTLKRHFSAANLWATEKEALAHGINFGKQIIDGHVDNCSVIGL